MKVALILTGHMRCWKEAYDNTWDRIISRWDADVFIATWDNVGYWTSPENDPENLGINKHSPMLNVNDVIAAYEPKEIRVFNQEFYKEQFEKEAEWFQPYCKEIRAKNVLSQFFLQGVGMRDDIGHYREYDMIIRMRPDMILHDQLPELDPNFIYTINHPNHNGMGTGDMFLAGSPNVIEHMWLRYLPQNLKQQTKAMNRFCPHILTEQAVSVIGLRLNKHHKKMNISKTLVHTPNGQYQDYQP